MKSFRGYLSIILLLESVPAVLSAYSLVEFRVFGEVLDHRGNIVTHANISFTQENDPQKIFSTTTDSLGKYSLTLNTIVTVVQNDDYIANTTSLDPNYPNPFNPSTIIPYRIKSPRSVQLVIFNILGQPIRTLVDSFQEPGHHEIIWDGRDNRRRSVSSGVYIVRLQTDKERFTRKILLIDNALLFRGRSGKSIERGGIGASYTVRISGDKIEDWEQRNIWIDTDRELNFVVTSLIFDPILERIIRANINKPEGKLSLQDLQSIERLGFPFGTTGLESLKGIEYLSHLTGLNLGGMIKDISNLIELPELRHLTWSFYNHFNIDSLDFSSIEKLTQLTSFSLTGSNISDISFVSTLTNLEDLLLRGNKISDLSPLANLQSLHSLYLDWNEIHDLSPLIRLQKLQTLSLENNQIEDISPLLQLGNLKLIFLADNPLNEHSRESIILSLKERGIYVFTQIGY